jgi:hypothetical protein
MAGVRFTVVFRASAEEELTRLYVNSALPGERRDLSFAANQLEKELRVDPQLKGARHAKIHDLYVWRQPPLIAYYQISEPDRMVTVVWVRRVKRLRSEP